MGQKQIQNLNNQLKTKQIRLISKAKNKKLLFSGLLRMESHQSSRTRINQAKRDQLVLTANSKSHFDKINSPQKPVALSPREAVGIESLEFIKIPISGALTSYIRKHCHSLLKRFSARPNKYHLKFRIQPAAKNFEGTISDFKVEGVIDIRGRKSLRATTKNSDVRQAVDRTIEALEKQVRRETEKKEKSRNFKRKKKPWAFGDTHGSEEG